MKHWFWLLLIFTTLVWYIIATIVVAVRGTKNIKDLLNGKEDTT